MTTFRNPVELLPEMIDRIVRGFDPLQIILFGSRARGDAREDSDIDLMVVTPSIDNKHRITAAILDSMADMPVAKDVVVVTPGEIERQRENVGSVVRPAMLEGKVVYVR